MKALFYSLVDFFSDVIGFLKKKFKDVSFQNYQLAALLLGNYTALLYPIGVC